MPSHTATSSSSSTSSPFFSRLKLLAGEDHCYQGTRHLHNQQTNTPEYLVFLHNIFHFNSSTRVTQSCTVSDIVKSASIASLRSQPQYLRPRSDRLQWEIGPPAPAPAPIPGVGQSRPAPHTRVGQNHQNFVLSASLLSAPHTRSYHSVGAEQTSNTRILDCLLFFHDQRSCSCQSNTTKNTILPGLQTV